MQTSIMRIPLTCLLTFLILGLWIGDSIAQQNIKDSLVHQGFIRQYTIHLPPNYANLDTLPLVIFLHGGSGNAQSAQNFTQLNPVSNQAPFMVAYPQGYALANGGGFTWADGRGTSADRQQIDDLGFIEKMMDQVLDKFDVNPDRVYLAGFSNGGFLTQRIACAYGERFAAIASLGSTMDVNLRASCQPTEPLPTLILTGTADPLVPYEGGEMNGNVVDIVSTTEVLAFWREQNNCQTMLDTVDLPDIDTTDHSTVSTLGFTDCDCQAEVSHIRINGGGHTWPGVEIVSYEALAGETNEDIHASEVLWDFFKQHRRCRQLTSANNHHMSPTWKVYPNPTQGQVRVQTQSPIKQVVVYTMQGKMLHKRELNTFTFTLNMEEEPPGTYLLRIWQQDGLVAQRLIEKHE